MAIGFLNIALLCVILLFLFLPVALAEIECAPFYDSMNDLSSITGNGGTVTGSLTFVPGVNGDAADFNGASLIRYPGSTFNAVDGSLSLWFRKNSGATSGGIWQIGNIGSPNSFGVFFNYLDDVFFEIKFNNSIYYQARKSNVLSQTNYTHLTAVWKTRGNVTSIKLFTNGVYASGTSSTWPFVHNQGFLDIGRTGFYGFGQGDIDEVRFFDHALSDPEVYAEYVYSSNRFRRQGTAKPVSTGNVKVIGKDVYVNGRLFRAKGVGYQPVPIGSWNSQQTLNFIYTDPGIISRDVPLIRKMNANVVRFWGELNDTVLLDALYNNGQKPIYAIMAFEVPWTGINYSNSTTTAAYENEFRQYVNRFKGHPTVLAWAIGNENNLHYTGNKADWYRFANRLAKVAYEAEGATYHPTIVVNGYLLYFGDTAYSSDDLSMNYTDVWGHNSYTGYDFNCYFDYYDALSAKPLILTEFGIDSLNHTSNAEYQEIQAQWDSHIWDQVRQNAVGGAVMAYSDEWWKAGSYGIHNPGGYPTDVQPDGYADEEWWGLMAVQDNGSSPDIMIPRQAYYALKSAYWENTTDLTVRSFRVLSPLQPNTSSEVMFAYDVFNSGEEDMDNLRFRIDTDSSVPDIINDIPLSVPMNSSYFGLVHWRYPLAGTYHPVYHIDYNNQYNETDEGNNALATEVTVAANNIPPGYSGSPVVMKQMSSSHGVEAR